MFLSALHSLGFCQLGSLVPQFLGVGRILYQHSKVAFSKDSKLMEVATTGLNMG